MPPPQLSEAPRSGAAPGLRPPSRVALGIVEALGGALAWTPISVSLFFARRIGDLLWLLGVKRRTILANLEHVFGEDKSPAERRRIAREAWQNLVMTVIELLVAVHPRGRRTLAERNRFTPQELSDDMDTDPRAVIFIVAHSGNVDAGAVHRTERYETPLSVLMKPLENAVFNDLLVETRRGMNVSVLSTKDPDVIGRINEKVEHGEGICILPDQNARKRGVVVDFLGRPASTYKGAASAVLSNPGCRPIIAVPTRLPDHRQEVFISEIEDFTPTGDHDEDVKALTQRICDEMGRFILARPGSYLWHHRRWGRLGRPEPATHG